MGPVDVQKMISNFKIRLCCKVLGLFVLLLLLLFTYVISKLFYVNIMFIGPGIIFIVE